MENEYHQGILPNTKNWRGEKNGMNGDKMFEKKAKKEKEIVGSRIRKMKN